ncbi:MAG: GNAT family N-acetyltransferase [Solobacterium sp.]|nr:GNAT family N-acetyltransferase [Solobacterium sp.]
MIIRPLRPQEYGVLPGFLYEAIFIPEGADPPDKSIVCRPELALYYRDFGKGRGDLAMAAEEDGEIVGCAWTRLMHDYGYVDDETPSFAVAVLEPYRSRGIGTALMKAMLKTLKAHGFHQASLSVQKENPAFRLYRRLGFSVIDDREEEVLMVCPL